MTKNELLKQINEGQIRGAQAKLASKLGLSTASVANWFSGKSFPSAENIKKMARAYKLDEKELKATFLDDNEFTNAIRAIPLTDKNTISLPILADVPAGLPDFSEADVETFWDIPRWVFPGADFVVKCNGDSLEPKLHLGDYCVIRKTEEPLHGRAMVVKTENGICMKVINKLKDGTIELRSTNAKYKPFIPQELTIVGLIIGHWRRDDKENWNELDA